VRLAVITLGHVHTEDLVALTPLFEHIEQLVLDIPPRDELSQHRAEFNRAVDAASTDWILIVREREVIDEALAKEIAKAASDVQARGFRIRSTPFYAGRPLRIGKDSGEVRLFHRRYYMRFANKGQWDEILIQGTVVRLVNALRSVTFASADEHRKHLAERAAPHSSPRRVLLFLRYLIGTRTFDRNTLRYLWIEAAFDVPLRAG
jgi:transcriptional regulator of nitric oxide reductase